MADKLVYAALAEDVAAGFRELGARRVGEALFAGRTYPRRGLCGGVGLVGEVDGD